MRFGQRADGSLPHRRLLGFSSTGGSRAAWAGWLAGIVTRQFSATPTSSAPYRQSRDAPTPPTITSDHHHHHHHHCITSRRRRLHLALPSSRPPSRRAEQAASPLQPADHRLQWSSFPFTFLTGTVRRRRPPPPVVSSRLVSPLRATAALTHPLHSQPHLGPGNNIYVIYIYTLTNPHDTTPNSGMHLL